MWLAINWTNRTYAMYERKAQAVEEFRANRCDEVVALKELIETYEKSKGGKGKWRTMNRT